MDEDLFPTLAAAVDYLHDAGWKCGKSKLADDTRKDKIKKTEEGNYTRERLDRYARRHCKRLDGTVRRDERIEKLVERKLLADTKVSESNARVKELEEQIRNRELIRAVDVAVQIAGLFAQLRADWDSAIHGKITEFIVACRGDEEFAPEVTELLLNEKARCLHRFFLAWERGQPLMVPREAVLEALRELAGEKRAAAL